MDRHRGAAGLAGLSPTPRSPLDRGSRILVVAQRSAVGEAIVRRLRDGGFTDVVVDPDDLDPTDRDAVFAAFRAIRPRHVVLAASTGGDERASASAPHEVLSVNLRAQVDVMDAALDVGVERLLLVGSSRVYPASAPQPVPESALLTGRPEPAHEPYAIAHLVGLRHVHAVRREFGLPWIAVTPSELYGFPGASGPLDALVDRIRRAHDAGAAEAVLPGSPADVRALLHLDDFADACLHVLDVCDGDEHVNVGPPVATTNAELAALAAAAVGFTGAIRWDAAAAAERPRPVLDVTALAAAGWTARIEPADGVAALATRERAR